MELRLVVCILTVCISTTHEVSMKTICLALTIIFIMCVSTFGSDVSCPAKTKIKVQYTFEDPSEFQGTYVFCCKNAGLNYRTNIFWCHALDYDGGWEFISLQPPYTILPKDRP